MTPPELEDVLALIADRAGHHLSVYLAAAKDPGESLAHRVSELIQSEPDEWSGWYNPKAVAQEFSHLPRSLSERDGSAGRGGTGVFLADGFARVVAMPAATPVRVVAGGCFYLKPVLAAIQADHEFHLLTLSRHRAQLFHGSADRLRPVPVSDMPAGMEDPYLAQEHGKRHTLHTVGQPHGRRVEAVFHGHTSSPSDEKHDLERYVRRVDAAVGAALRQSRTPLVLAGVGEEQAVYRRLNSYPHLLDNGVGGNPDHRSAADLHAAAWPLVCDASPRPADAAIRQYDHLRGTGRTADEIAEVVPAAADGELGALLVSPGRDVWGTFDPVRRAVEVHPTRQPGDDELTNLAAVHVLRHGGVVHTIGSLDLGDRDVLALRWLPMDRHGKGGPS